MMPIRKGADYCHVAELRRFFTLVWGAVLMCFSFVPTFRHFRAPSLHFVPRRLSCAHVNASGG